MPPVYLRIDFNIFFISGGRNVKPVFIHCVNLSIKRFYMYGNIKLKNNWLYWKWNAMKSFSIYFWAYWTRQSKKQDMIGQPRLSIFQISPSHLFHPTIKITIFPQLNPWIQLIFKQTPVYRVSENKKTLSRLNARYFLHTELSLLSFWLLYAYNTLSC